MKIPLWLFYLSAFIFGISFGHCVTHYRGGPEWDKIAKYKYVVRATYLSDDYLTCYPCGIKKACDSLKEVLEVINLYNTNGLSLVDLSVTPKTLYEWEMKKDE